jgi:hypothetical protein
MRFISILVAAVMIFLGILFFITAFAAESAVQESAAGSLATAAFAFGSLVTLSIIATSLSQIEKELRHANERDDRMAEFHRNWAQWQEKSLEYVVRQRNLDVTTKSTADQ